MAKNGKRVGDVLVAMDEVKGVRLLREFATACFTNAQSHHDAANLLADDGYHGAAVALAVIGVEEFAKSILYTAAALRPSEWAVLGQELRIHELKHAIAGAAEGAQIESHEWWAVVASESGSWPSKKERLEDMFGSLLGQGLAWLLGDPGEAKRFYRQAQTKLTQLLVDTELKNAGLYVDLDPQGQVLTPARVEPQVQSMILELEWYLEVYGELLEVLREDEMWERFAQSVGKAAKRAPTPQPDGSEGSP